MIIALTLSGCGIPRRGGAAAPQSPATPESADAPLAPEAPPQVIPNTLALAIPEGYTLPQIGMLLEEMGVGTVIDFIEAAQTADFSGFPFIAARSPNPNRFFALEGYLFPDTYEIYPDDTPESVIRRILSNTENSIGGDLRQTIAEKGYTIDEIIILASIVQKESLGNDTVKPLVSSVIRNRINTGMMLQMCKTGFYVRDYINPFFDGDADHFHNFYNTYRLSGLPAGAICNPGLNAIHAALFPAETNYLFYIWDNDDGFHFAVTYEEHNANVQKYLR